MRAIVGFVLLAFPLMAHAEIKTQTIDYKHGDVLLQGYLAYDDAAPGQRPGVLIIHEWMGHNPYVRQRAEQLAKEGYVAFALDMYGKGVHAKDFNEAGQLAGKYKNDRPLMRARAAAGLEVLAKHAKTDPKKLAAIGYCFGGTTALELARSGADLAATVSFHGDLATPNATDAKNIKGKVLVCHGADDPFVPPAQVAAFEKEMRDAKVDWELIKYGNAVHSFTNKEAGNDPSKGLAYEPKADARSWQAMLGLFREAFGQ